MRSALRIRPLMCAAIAAVACVFSATAQAQQPVCSAWLIESSRFMNVPFGSFMPDRSFVPRSTKPESNIPTIDLPVNIGVIKCATELILFDPGGCNRTPACGYMPLTIEEVYGKVLKGKAVIVDGEMEISPGVKIHPAFRAHTAGSQLLEVPTAIGKLVFGSDAFSSYEGIRDWMTANVQQTDTVQQFLAYEKCYKITGGYNNCVAAHEPLSYTDKYPLTKNSWVALNGGRMAEITLAPGEKSRKP